MINAAVMLLLLQIGGVETNPGPNVFTMISFLTQNGWKQQIAEEWDDDIIMKKTSYSFKLHEAFSVNI